MPPITFNWQIVKVGLVLWKIYQLILWKILSNDTFSKWHMILCTIKHWRVKNWALGGGASWAGSFHDELSMFQSSCDGVKEGRSKDKRRLKMRHQPTKSPTPQNLLNWRIVMISLTQSIQHFCKLCSSSSPNILNILIFFVHLVVNYHDHRRWCHAPIAFTIILFATLFVCYVDNIISKFWILRVYLLLYRTFILYSKYI